MLGKSADTRATAVVVNDFIAIGESTGVRDADGMVDAVDERHSSERDRDRVLRARRNRRIQVDRLTTFGVGERIGQSNRRRVHNNGKERVLAGQTADTATSAVAINHRFAGGKSMQVAEVDGFGRRLIAACHRCLGVDRDAEAMLLARGSGGVQGPVRTARDAASQRGQSNGRFINHFDIIGVAIRQAADIGTAAGTVDDRFAILEAVAVSQIDRSAGDTDGNAGIESNAKTAGGTGSRWRR